MDLEIAVRQDEPFTTDPLGLLRADHRRLQRCFDLYRESEDAAQSALLVHDIVLVVKLHLDIESTVFYPAYFHAINDKLRHRRWIGQHAAERKLLGDIAYADPGDESLEHSLAALARRLSVHALSKQLHSRRDERPTALKQQVPSGLRAGAAPPRIDSRQLDYKTEMNWLHRPRPTSALPMPTGQNCISRPP